MSTSLVNEALAYYETLLTTEFPPADWWKDYVDQFRLHFVDEVPIESYALRPFMIDEDTYGALTTSLTPIARAFTLAADRLAKDEVLRQTIGIPEYLDPLLEIDRDHGKPSCLARLDAIRTSEGRLSIIEYNSEPQSAPGQYELGKAFEGLPVVEAFRTKYRTRSVDLYDRVQTTLERRGRARGCGLPTVAVLQKNLYTERPRESTWIRPLMHASARGCKLVFVDPAELEYSSGVLRAGDLSIDMVAFLGWSMIFNEPERVSHVLTAVTDGKVEVFGGISRGLLASNKITLELLSDPEHRHIFPPDMAPALDAHIPWTRGLRERKTVYHGEVIDLVPFVASHREQFIVKPSARGGGVGVVVGDEVSDEAWNKILKRTIAQRGVVQERVVPARERWPIVDPQGNFELMELNCEFTPYAWDGEVVDGVLCRITSGTVLNDLGGPLSTANGIDTATWIIGR